MRVTCLHAGWLASLSEALRNDLIAALNPAEAQALLYGWPYWARANQLPPDGDWRVWLLLAGRGFGKTRAGAELIRARAMALAARRLALVAPTAGDARDIMVEGESGILAISPPWERPRYEPSKRRLTWPNGAIATLFSADEPERLRGPQHDAAWCDELASWRYPEAWDMLMLGLRLGTDPRVVVTTTPRPTKLIRELIADPTVVVTRGTTHENRANLAPVFLGQIVRKYQGTRLGRQELEAEILEDVPGALWNRGVIEATRASRAPALIRVVVAIESGCELDGRRRRNRHHHSRQGRRWTRVGDRRRLRALSAHGMGEDRNFSLSRASRRSNRC
jgi:phage terminase large subunit-like protein